MRMIKRISNNEKEESMKLIGWAIMFVLGINSLSVFSHGEDKPGPNGGFLRMPGTFHTEVILTSTNTLKIFLLDINWKNPTVKNSSLKVIHKESKLLANCSVESNYFICQFSDNVDLKKKGELLVEADMNGQKGMAVSYELPLKLKKTNSDHINHHK